MAILNSQHEPPNGDEKILRVAWQGHLRGQVPIIDGAFAREFWADLLRPAGSVDGFRYYWLADFTLVGKWILVTLDETGEMAHDYIE